TGVTDWACSEETETSVTTGKSTLRSMDQFSTHRAAVAISTTAAGEESSSIQAIAAHAVKGRRAQIYLAGNPGYLSCKSTPPPVALTATPCGVPEPMRTSRSGARPRVCSGNVASGLES